LRVAGVNQIPQSTNFNKNILFDKFQNIFNGNFDSVTPVTHYFTAPLRARYIRINPQSFYGKVAMRFEIQGCFMPYPSKKKTITY
jgi:hypothetical protein